jgi:phosphomannomutase
VEGKSLGELLADLYRRVGEFHTGRENLHLSPQLADDYAGRMATLPTTLAGRKVTQIITMDGIKLLLEGDAWVLFRKSGTEPVVRVYAEARSAAALLELTAAAVAFVKG